MRSQELRKRLIQKIIKWRRIPQLSFGSESNRRELLTLFCLYRVKKRREEQRRRRRFCVRPIFMERQRALQGASGNLIKEMEQLDAEKYYEFLRMDVSTFCELLLLVGPSIEKQHAVRNPISAATRLQICLRYLASGDIMPSISFSFRVGVNTVSKIISETCQPIWDILSPMVFPEITEELWTQKAEEFRTKWNFPNCIGAIDGKHMNLQAPPNSGSTFYNYTGSHNIVLLAVTDANSCFIAVDIGAEGRRSDGGTFIESEIEIHLNNDTMNLPSWRLIEEDGPRLPFVIVGDEAFALKSYMMRPYPKSHHLNLKKKIFNYRLSRARRTVECAFGILTSRWRIFTRPLSTNVHNTTRLVQATVCLHNFILERDFRLLDKNRRYSIFVRSEDVNIHRHMYEAVNETGEDITASGIREEFSKYFYNNGALDCQWERALRNDY